MQILYFGTTGAWMRHNILSVFPLFLDEELPDYIMVMVANKKTSQQMADDLSLFLGNNTSKFTIWYAESRPKVYITSLIKLHIVFCQVTLLISTILSVLDITCICLLFLGYRVSSRS